MHPPSKTKWPKQKNQNLRTLLPLTAIKNTPNPKFVQNLSRAIVFGGSSPGDWNLSKICQNLSENYRFSNFDKFLTNFPRTRTIKNNHRDKFWTNLVFGAFLNAVRWKRVRNPRHYPCKPIPLNSGVKIHPPRSRDILFCRPLPAVPFWVFVVFTKVQWKEDQTGYLFARFFGEETILPCWYHWQQHCSKLICHARRKKSISNSCRLFDVYTHSYWSQIC